MSTITTTTTAVERPRHLHTAKPSFFGLVGGELFKIRHQWATWIMLIVLVGIMFLPYLVGLFVPSIPDSLANHPLAFLTRWAGVNLGLFRAVSGIMLLILTARVIGLEYNLGTIRILLGRGVGRVQLLLAKLLAVAICAILVLILSLVLNAVLHIGMVGIRAGNLNAFNALDSTYWHNVGIYILTILLNMAVTILVATGFTVLGRSLAFGMTFSVAWFPVDNILVTILLLVFDLTQNTFWQNVSAYLLGPNLNIMAGVITGIPDWQFGAPPLVTVDGTHTVVVALVYAAIFAIGAFWLTWKRDVHE
jgi:ABC-2 type transport system permease protein